VQVGDLEQVVPGPGVDVVQQHAHPHAALGGAHQGRGQQAPGQSSFQR